MALSSRVAPSHALVEPLLVVDDEEEEEEISKAYVYKLTRGLQWRGYAARLAPRGGRPLVAPRGRGSAHASLNVLPDMHVTKA